MKKMKSKEDAEDTYIHMWKQMTGSRNDEHEDHASFNKQEHKNEELKKIYNVKMKKRTQRGREKED